MSVLGIDTSTAVCAAALVSDGSVISSAEAGTPRAHAEKLLATIDECLGPAPGQPPDAVAVASGPGSFTGLRIGLSAAKGLCFARGPALVTVPTFEAWAFGVVLDGRAADGAPLLAVMSAGRDDVYVATYRRTGPVVVVDRAPSVIPVNELREFVKGAGDAVVMTDDRVRAPAWFAGLPPERVVFVTGGGRNPAVSVALLGERMFRSGETADLRSAEPAYVREFSYKLKNGRGA
jgi:tRNA threonylcarbamoyl adenosine modification protein YeaZ